MLHLPQAWRNAYALCCLLDCVVQLAGEGEAVGEEEAAREELGKEAGGEQEQGKEKRGSVEGNGDLRRQRHQEEVLSGCLRQLDMGLMMGGPLWRRHVHGLVACLHTALGAGPVVLEDGEQEEEEATQEGRPAKRRRREGAGEVGARQQQHQQWCGRVGMEGGQEEGGEDGVGGNEEEEEVEEVEEAGGRCTGPGMGTGAGRHRGLPLLLRPEPDPRVRLPRGSLSDRPPRQPLPVLYDPPALEEFLLSYMVPEQPVVICGEREMGRLGFQAGGGGCGRAGFNADRYNSGPWFARRLPWKGSPNGVILYGRLTGALFGCKLLCLHVHPSSTALGFGAASRTPTPLAIEGHQFRACVSTLFDQSLGPYPCPRGTGANAIAVVSPRRHGALARHGAVGGPVIPAAGGGRPYGACGGTARTIQRPCTLLVSWGASVRCRYQLLLLPVLLVLCLGQGLAPCAGF